MPRRKLRKSKQKWKNREEDKAKIIIISVEEESVRATCEEACVCERETQKQKSSGRKQKTSKQVHFTVLPDRYEPLEEDRASDTAIDENKDNQEKYKRTLEKLFATPGSVWSLDCRVSARHTPGH
ncbi:required for drug-induced death protein 1 isoform X2 [Hemibagrus wyckioides]|uniref:required for drug-induced death protein 1 isoform X2 n=1 Tax=Hemibagrus wyckioides TaxID=337641 RepID=UPI00266B5CA4|nr:required for drug-induced death protein 1 isoform X2 [Hemibagrus wyckioides]